MAALLRRRWRSGWGEETRERRARATAWRDLWRWDGIWRGAWTAGLLAEAKAMPIRRSSEEVGNVLVWW